MITGKGKVIAHIGFPTESFKAPMIYNPWFEARGIDAIVGGGGLIQLPALFSALPSQPPATLLGTSKLAGFAGTAADHHRAEAYLITLAA